MGKPLFSILVAVFMIAGCEGKANKGPKLNGTDAPSADQTNKAAPSAADETASAITYVLDVNSATPQQLLAVPGMTDELQSLIMDTRPFVDMEELNDELRYFGLSSKDIKKLYEHMFLIIDLNTAPKEDFRFVPDMPRNLAHKIENARPYDNLSDLKKNLESTRQKDKADRYMQYFKLTKPKK